MNTAKRILVKSTSDDLASEFAPDRPVRLSTFTKEQHEAEVRAGVLAHHAGLRTFARYLTSNRDQADDLVQDAILRALSSADKFMPGTNFRGWIFTIARNLFYSSYRKPSNKHTPLHDLVIEPAIQPNQEQCLEFCDFRRAFSELGSEQRAALLLVGVDGLSYEDAATASKCAVGTVKSRVSRARLSLKSLLSGSQLAIARAANEPIAGTHLISALRTPPRLIASIRHRTDRQPILSLPHKPTRPVGPAIVPMLQLGLRPSEGHRQAKPTLPNILIALPRVETMNARIQAN